MATFISHSPAETEALGEAWGRTAKPGLVVGLSGDLGAGKTQLVKGLARGLGTTARVHSPTFTLINIYGGGRLPLFHLDLYRLENTQQILEAGLEEYLRPEGVTVIEWAERWLAQEARDEGRGTGVEGQRPSRPSFLECRLPPPASRLLSVQIETLNDTQRRITYEDSGA